MEGAMRAGADAAERARQALGPAADRAATAAVRRRIA
jgi:hypothetical protein